MTAIEARRVLLKGMATYLRREMTTHALLSAAAFKLGLELHTLGSTKSPAKPSKKKARK